MAIEQFIEANFRIVVGYLLLMRWGCGIFFRANVRKPFVEKTLLDQTETEVVPEKQAAVPNSSERLGKRLVWLLFLIPMLVYLFIPTVLGEPIGYYDAVRWIFVALAVVSILLYIWSRHVDGAFGEPLSYEEQFIQRSKVPPFRIVRHPVELSDAVFFLALAAISGRPIAGMFALGAILLQHLLVIPQKDAELKRALGADFVSYTQSGGRVLPRLPSLKQAQYQVPKRYGLTAIIALLTGLSILFGGLNLLRYYFPFPAEVYFFASSQIVAICLAQMVFGSAPRIISALVGAMLLPTFLAIHLYLSGNNLNLTGMSSVLFMAFSVILGALVGYCIGGAAAGFFLVTDWFENWFSSKK